MKFKKILTIQKFFSKLNLLLLILFQFFPVSTNSQNLCNIKIADSMMSSFNGNDIIYNYGKVDEMRFSKSALTPYTAPYAKEIDYFYVTEIHGLDLNKSHNDVVIL